MLHASAMQRARNLANLTKQRMITKGTATRRNNGYGIRNALGLGMEQFIDRVGFSVMHAFFLG
jgi:hypothetical protein